MPAAALAPGVSGRRRMQRASIRPHKRSRWPIGATFRAHRALRHRVPRFGSRADSVSPLALRPHLAVGLLFSVERERSPHAVKCIRRGWLHHPSIFLSGRPDGPIHPRARAGAVLVRVGGCSTAQRTDDHARSGVSGCCRKRGRPRRAHALSRSAVLVRPGSARLRPAIPGDNAATHRDVPARSVVL